MGKVTKRGQGRGGDKQRLRVKPTIPVDMVWLTEMLEQMEHGDGKDLATTVGCSTSQISNLRKGKRWPEWLVVRVSHALAIPLPRAYYPDEATYRWVRRLYDARHVLDTSELEMLDAKVARAIDGYVAASQSLDGDDSSHANHHQ